MTADIGPSLSHPPADPPRELTRRVRRKSWFEPRVRFWLLIGLFLLIAGSCYLIQGMIARNRELWLIEHGEKVEALILRANDEEALKRPQPFDSVVTVRFDWHGQTITPKPRRLEGREDFITPGTRLPIRVNASDTDDWTWRSEPMPVISRAMGALLVIPLSVLAFIGASWARARILRVWRDGVVEEAVLVEMRTSSLAPLAGHARVSPHDESDSRIYSVYVPGRMARMRPGESLFILKLPGKTGRAIAAAWYE